MGGFVKVLEILLVCGSLAGAGTLGTLAVLDETKAASGSGVVSDGTAAGARTASEISACLSGKGLEIITADFPTPADATAVGATSVDGDAIIIVVFQTEAAAAQFRGAFEGLQPPGGLILDLGNALLAYAIPPDVQTRADVEGCVLGESFEPPPVEPPAGGTLTEICLENLGYDVEDISDIHPDPVESLRVTGGPRVDVLVFVFLFDDEGDALEFMEVYAPDQEVHNLGLAIVEYTEQPDVDVLAGVEGCATGTL